MQAVAGAVIAAAGMGARVGLGMPKCMIEIEGKTLLSRLVESLSKSVPAIHVVVGYREDLVIDFCSRFHREVVLVRNPEYRSTGVACSYALGARHIRGKVAYVDGDLLIADESLQGFLGLAVEHETLVGLTRAKSENAVFAKTEDVAGKLTITGFSRSETSPWEWANVVCGSSDLMQDAPGYVFERLIERLPLSGKEIELAEVDTASDLVAAREFMRRGPGIAR